MNPDTQATATTRCGLDMGALIFGLALVVAAIVAFGVMQKDQLSFANPLWLVGMMVAFGAALTVIATVFRCLDMQSRDEAFALPPGSVRTLLALGVMMLFAFFGVAFVGQQKPPVGAKVQETEVDAKKLDDEVKRFERLGLVAIAASAPEPDKPVRLTLYHNQTRPTDVADLQKQIVTALVTLLTTVIGFYFGSRSAEGPRRDAGKDNPSDDGLAAAQAETTAALDRAKTLAAKPVPADRSTLVTETRRAVEAAQARVDARLQVASQGRAGSTERAGAVSALRAELAAYTQLLDTLERQLDG